MIAVEMSGLMRFLFVIAIFSFWFSGFRIAGAGVEMVMMHDGVEHQGIGPVSFGTPHGVDGEEYEMPIAQGRINNRRHASQFIPADEHSANQQLTMIGIETDDCADGIARWLAGTPPGCSSA